MFKHIVMVKFKPEVSQEQRVEAAKKLGEALAQIPGKNITMGETSDVQAKPLYDAVTLIDFDSEAELKAHLDHPIHKGIEAQLQAMCSDILVLNLLC